MKKEYLLLIGSCIISLIVLGTFVYFVDFRELRHFDDITGTKFDPEIGWVTIPNAKIPFEESIISFNSIGFRSPEVDIEKKHLILIGDSVTYGLGVQDKDTLGYNLQIDDLQTQNMGVSGYGLGQELLFFERNIQHLNPEIAIIIICTRNDYYDTTTNERNSKSKPLFYFENDELVYPKETISNESCWNLHSSKKYMEILGAKKEKYISKICPREILNKTDAKNVIEGILNKFNQNFQENGIELLFVISPERMELKNKVKSENYLFFENLMEENNFEYVNLYNEFEKFENIDEIYLGETHYNLNGVKNISFIVEKRLKS